MVVFDTTLRFKCIKFGSIFYLVLKCNFPSLFINIDVMYADNIMFCINMYWYLKKS